VIAVVLTSTAPAAACPKCGHPSERVHSRYCRTLADLPVGGRRLIIRLSARRFFCPHPGCDRAVFCERVPAFADAHARSTARLTVHPGRRGMMAASRPVG
jgi:transposase